MSGIASQDPNDCYFRKVCCCLVSLKIKPEIQGIGWKYWKTNGSHFVVYIPSFLSHNFLVLWYQ
jgi:hypothetical protein